VGGSDFGFAFGDMARFRVSIFKQRGNIGMVLRQIPVNKLTPEQLGLPEVVTKMVLRPRGLMLVTGPTGSGKTTTLATLVNYINDFQIKSGVLKSQAYDTTMYVLAGLLVGGFVCNLLVRPVSPRWFMTEEELAAERKLGHDAAAVNALGGNVAAVSGRGGRRGLVAIFWLFVGIPLAWGVWNTVGKALVLFR
jgi:hypothetical protein